MPLQAQQAISALYANPAKALFVGFYPKLLIPWLGTSYSQNSRA
jgi:hypothetical protein